MNKPTPSQQPELPTNYIDRPIAEEMKASYIDYAMSVIVGRALPDVRDGLKPVHRRILYAMDEMGMRYNKPYKKSARIVGDVLGKYHPHGDQAVYDAMVRMVQDFSLRHPLIDGQGNFGSVDGDPAAAMRYTEVRLARIADELLADIDKETVDFVPNYDGSTVEPSVMPTRLPNLLVNGSSGIAVGMATNVPPHNLAEVCDAVVACVETPETTSKDLMKIMKGPDFPTAGIIRGKTGIRDYFERGRGSIRVQARAEIEDIKGNRQAIIVTELPYQVNKAMLLETIAQLVRDKKIHDISDIRDESDRRGMRVVIEVKRDGNAQVVLNQLYKHTTMETTFGVILLALVEGRPRVLSVRDMIGHYIEHRKVVILRRTRDLLRKAQERAHILEGLLIAIKNLDRVIKIIRSSKDVAEARERLMKEFELTQVQSQAILDMRLHQLTRLEADQIEDEYKALLKLISEYKSILGDPKKVLKIIVQETQELREQFADKRRTEITAESAELSLEDLITKEEVVITISNSGYIKRTPTAVFRAQGRGGSGSTGAGVKEEDFIEQLFVTDSHATILLFTSRGRCYALKAYEIPEGSKASRGKAIVNLVQLSSNEEKITSTVAIRSFEEAKGKETFLAMCTRNGTVKKTPLLDFETIRRSGMIAITLDEGDVLVDAQHTQAGNECMIATQDGMSIRFDEADLRAMGRAAKGVRGIRLAKGDQVVGMEVAKSKDATLVTVCESGFGKRTALSEYRDQARGGGGIITIKASDRNGKVVGIKVVSDKDDLMIVTEQGVTIRLRCKDIRTISRNTQGVRLVRLDEGDKVSRVAPVVAEEATPPAAA